MLQRERPIKILLVGPDGVGKSTVRAQLLAQFEAADLPTTIQHYRPNVLFPRAAAVDNSNPHNDEKSRRGLLTLPKLLATFVDTIWGLHTQKRGRREATLIERGWFDQMVDPGRYRLHERSKRLIFCLGRVLPRVDLVILLTATPAAIYERKPELTLSEIQRQLREWRKIQHVVARQSIELSTSQTLETQEREIKSIVRAIVDPAFRTCRIPFTARRLDVRIGGTRTGGAIKVVRPDTKRAAIGLAAGRFFSRFDNGSIDFEASRISDLVAGDRPDSICKFNGSAPRRSILGLGVGSTLNSVVKYSPQGEDLGLLREIENLSRIQGVLRKPFRTPPIVYSGKLAEHDVLVTAALPQSSFKTELFDVTMLCAELQRSALQLVHGDLAPWNLRKTDRFIYIFDWESCTYEYRPFGDFVHYCVSATALLNIYSEPFLRSQLFGHTGAATELGTALSLCEQEVRTEVRKELEHWTDRGEDKRAALASRLLSHHLH